MPRSLVLLVFLAVVVPLGACAPQYRGGTVETAPRYAMPVAEAQAGLQRLGFQPGPVDGIYGPRTRQAVVNYQRIRGLRATGEIDQTFARSLRADLAALPGRPELAAPQVARAPDPGAEIPGSETPETARDLPPVEETVPATPAPGPAPATVYRDAGHDPSLVAETSTRPEDLVAVRFAEIDLDGDGDLDVIWNNTGSRYCGTGGCSFDIYFREGSGWRPVARLLAFEVDAAAGRTRGVRDLLVTGRRGSAVWQWNGRHYAPTA